MALKQVYNPLTSNFDLVDDPATGGNAFDSNRNTTGDGLSIGTNVGGTTLQEFLEAAFFPPVPPYASLNSDEVYEFGASPDLTLDWDVTENSNPITLITLTHNSGSGPLEPDSWNPYFGGITRVAGLTTTYSARVGIGNFGPVGVLGQTVNSLTPADSYTLNCKIRSTNVGTVSGIAFANADDISGSWSALNFTGPDAGTYTPVTGGPTSDQIHVLTLNGTLQDVTLVAPIDGSGTIQPLYVQEINGNMLIEACTLKKDGVGPNILLNGDFANWTATSTPSITPQGTDSVINNGISIVPTGNNQSGTRAAASEQNIDSTFLLHVAAGADSANQSVSVTWKSKRYWGKIASNSSPSDADILALTGAGVGSGNELADNLTKTYNGINGAGEYLMFAWPTSFGANPTFTVNGLPNTAFTKIRDNSDFVNASGYTTQYDVWISNTVQNSPITLFTIS